MISNEIRAAQEAYAARPYAVRWEDSHFSGTSRFNTFDEAFAYAQHQTTRVASWVKVAPYRSSMLWRTYIETPKGRIQLKYYFFAEDTSSYR